MFKFRKLRLAHTEDLEAEMIGYEDLTWTGNELRLGRRTVATIEPDHEWPGLWRAKIGDHLTDMTNRTRAKDAAQCIAASNLNAARETQRSPGIRYFDRAATSLST